MKKQKKINALLFCLILSFAPIPLANKPVYASDWFDYQDYTYKLTLTVNSSLVDEDLINFPVLVYINDSNVFDLMRDDMVNMLFADYGGNELPYELETYTENTEAFFWVALNVSSSEDTEFYLFFDNSGFFDNENVAGVWDKNYVVVHHGNDDPNDSNKVVDSSSYGIANGLYGNKTYINNGTDEIDGLIGKAQDFNRTNTESYTVVNSWSYDHLLNFTEKTVTYFVQTNGYQGAGQMVYEWGYWSSPYGDLSLIDYGANYHYHYIKNSSGYVDNDAFTTVSNTWLRRGYVWNSTDWFHLTETTYNYQGEFTGLLRCDSGALHFGSTSWGSDFFAGRIDEFRVSNITRSESWLDAEYYTAKLDDYNFILIGDLEVFQYTTDAIISLTFFALILAFAALGLIFAYK